MFCSSPGSSVCYSLIMRVVFKCVVCAGDGKGREGKEKGRHCTIKRIYNRERGNTSKTREKKRKIGKGKKGKKGIQGEKRKKGEKRRNGKTLSQKKKIDQLYKLK